MCVSVNFTCSTTSRIVSISSAEHQQGSHTSAALTQLWADPAPSQLHTRPLPHSNFNITLSSLLPKPLHFQPFLSMSLQSHPLPPVPAPIALLPAPSTNPKGSPPQASLRLPLTPSPAPLRWGGPAGLRSHLRARPAAPLAAGPARLAPAPGASGSRGPVPQRLRLQPSPARSVPRAAAAARAGSGRAGAVPGPGRVRAAARGPGGSRSP